MKGEAMEVRDASPGYAPQVEMRVVPDGYKQTEVGVIPEDWDVAAVDQKGEVLAGKALAINALGVQRPYLRTKNVFDGRIDTTDVLTMPMTDEQFRQFQVQRDDVLLNEGQSLELVGRCAIYNNEYPEPCAMQNALLRFRARAGVCANFASHLFRYCQQTGVFARIALQTTSVAHLGASRFERLRLAWPTEAEQRAIATALSDVDALLEALDRLIAKKRDIKQATMQQLLTGKTRLPGFEGEWAVKRMSEVADIDPENLSSSTHPAYAFNYIALEDVNIGKLESYSEVTFSSAPSRARRKLRAGDIIMATVRPSLKAHLYFSIAEGEWVCSTGFCVIRCRQEVSQPGYVFQHLFAHPISKQIEALIAGSNYPAISNKDVRDLELRTPPFEEQVGISDVLSEMDAELEALQQRRIKAAALKQAMLQELLTGRTRLVDPMPKECANG
ncbi:restriction endonuclease subunit S [Thioalkalivibrio paradoxus]|uniref:Restriction endonuclease n=1 Tax=Thioalkalivibrio paradoxus ARh 1 TaxID=713585 RepID=W0DI41_9GAMM|nr:restriction endonuclease subunit S [Thioalkalivibrio paradoxus]AHE98081.1 restriction endonuclease [Thioalkalivibrio paradoxus ARh 1]